MTKERIKGFETAGRSKMLVSFQVSNYKSFRSDAILNLNANRADKTIPGAILRPEDGSDKDAQLLAAAAIYGANASGKTNLIMALDYFTKAVAYSQSIWKPGSGTRVTPNALDAEKPTRMEVVVIVNGVRYRYGFEGNPRTFTREWLFSYPVGRERELFVRETNFETGEPQVTATFGRNLSGSIRDFNSSLRRANENSLLLSALAQDNQSEALDVFSYFYDANRIIDRTDQDNEIKFASRFTETMPDFRELLLGLLQTADQSIVDIDVEEIEKIASSEGSVDEISEIVPNYETRFNSIISGVTVTLPLNVQSRGVKSVYAMSAHACMSLLRGSLLIIDEIDTSMHPHLVAKLVSIFQNPATNPHGAQIIFSTHDTHLISIEHLRRDQVWFVEKTDGVSELFALSEFSPRKGENLEMSYLRGKFGAVPEGGVSLRLLGLSNQVSSSRSNQASVTEASDE
ncbi:AAA family ATPase [Stakelama marina]|uniref:ATP-binding protein n=1 Tax=Stakelama marina TaxID=2826939 RepID=A0A8T4IHE1_9SPHN|nr:ATP-binding protein [Stakelama marina]MBR0553987.1 ATP-binding protein [Stakelama marina]